MILDNETGCIYYIKELAGQCKIYEIIPTTDLLENHILIYEIKSEQCFGFTLKDGNFLFIDDEKVITVLTRAKESKKLVEVMELNLKEKDSPNFILDSTNH